MQKRGALIEDDAEGPSAKRNRPEPSTELAVIPQTSTALSVKHDEVYIF